MNTDSLQSLLMDRALGELSPEVADLLDHYLATNECARAEATRIESTIGIAGTAIQRYPERGHAALVHAGRLASIPSWWLGLAASLVVAALASTGGYFWGSRSPVGSVASVPPAPSLKPSGTARASSAPLPWTRYEIASTRGELRFVRVPSIPSKP